MLAQVYFQVEKLTFKILIIKRKSIFREKRVSKRPMAGEFPFDCLLLRVIWHTIVISCSSLKVCTLSVWVSITLTVLLYSMGNGDRTTFLQLISCQHVILWTILGKWFLGDLVLVRSLSTLFLSERLVIYFFCEIFIFFFNLDL